MALDLITTYFPEADSLSSDTLLQTRARLDTFIRIKYPDLDTRPNSVFGDLVVSPYTYLIASLESAMGKFMSDLDLEQVANGVIYNCDFVTKYLNNFAVVDQQTLQSSGVMRLVFCNDSAYTIDRRANYLFGADNVFSLRLPNPGSLNVLPVGSMPVPYSNDYVLKQISEINYAIDIGVVGSMTTQVIAGVAGTTDYAVTDMVQIVAVTNFNFGLPAESLATLAAKTRETFYSATLTTRSGANSYMAREFPDLVAVSPIVPGDTEAIRASVNPLGVANGKLDVCVQSKNFGTTVSQTIKLNYGGSGSSAFYGRMDLIEVPYVIDSISYAGDNTVVLGNQGSSGPIVIIGQSTNFAKAPLLTSSYSPYENYWLKIAMPSLSGTALITPIVADNGDQYAYFTVNYVSDPLVKVVSDALNSSDLTPIGVDTLVKSYVPTVIDTLLITYTKKPGTTMALDTARTEIFSYFNQLGYSSVYSSSKIYDAMFYAGASDVVSITATSNVQWSIADLISPVSVTAGPGSTAVPTPTSFASTVVASYALPATISNNLSATAAFNSTTYSVLDKRNRGYYIKKANILFSEVIL
jgi:hypothetical protein